MTMDEMGVAVVVGCGLWVFFAVLNALANLVRASAERYRDSQREIGDALRDANDMTVRLMDERDQYKLRALSAEEQLRLVREERDRLKKRVAYFDGDNGYRGTRDEPPVIGEVGPVTMRKGPLVTKCGRCDYPMPGRSSSGRSLRCNVCLVAESKEREQEVAGPFLGEPAFVETRRR
jgi:hypothetical protein